MLLQKTLTATDKTMQTTCFTGNTLMVNVVTASSVTLPSNDFDFKFEIYPECPGIPKDLMMESNEGNCIFQDMMCVKYNRVLNIMLEILQYPALDPTAWSVIKLRFIDVLYYDIK